jgi:hypothetical protein
MSYLACLNSFTMDNTLTFQGQEYMDKLITITQVHVPFWLRVRNLFCPFIEFRIEVYTKQIMPAYNVDRSIRTISYWHQFKNYLRRKWIKGGLQSSASEQKDA